MIARITKTIVDGLAAGEVVWDVDVRGFGVRLRRTQGRRRYVLKYDFKGRQRFYTIGAHGSPWTPEAARAEARRLLGELAAGRDPAECRDTDKGIPTLAAFVDRYIEQHARLKKKPATVENDQAIFRLHLVPALGRHRLDAITRPHVLALQASLASTPGNANNVLGLLSSLFTVAFRWGVLDERRGHANPVKYVQKFPQRKRQRFLTEDELARVGRALEDLQHARPWHVAAILLLALTGARPSEILALRWESVDAERKVLRLQESKTGPKDVPMSGPALEVLARLPRIQGSPWVLPGRTPEVHLAELSHAWSDIRRLAALPKEVRLYDLRHTFASRAAWSGYSLPIIGGMLGHRRQETTQRYVHLQNRPLLEAADHVGSNIAAALTPARE